MTTYKKFKNIYVIPLLVLLCLLILCSAVPQRTVRADEASTEYSDVLEDLEKDENFNADNYPDKTDDFSIRIIQIAESVNNELFIYTYQPCQSVFPLVATEINVAFKRDLVSSYLYGLTLLNSSGVFCKYKVEDFTVKPDPVRYYNITSIYREWHKGIDPDSEGGLVGRVSFGVSSLWTATTEADGVHYSRRDLDFVSITSKYTNALFYENNLWMPIGYTVSGGFSHFVAFSVDRDIDTLVEVQICFVATETEHREWWLFFEKDVDFGSTSHNIIITDKDRAVISTVSTFTRDDYLRSRISTAREFMSSENISKDSDQGKKIASEQYVVRFHESEYSKSNTMSGSYERFTTISDVTLLRLLFERDGVVYNVGVVDNKLTGTDPPITVDPSVSDESTSFWARIAKYLGVSEDTLTVIAVVIVFVILLLPVLSVVFPVVGNILLSGLKGLWWLICLPFKGIAALITKIKDRGAQ